MRFRTGLVLGFAIGYAIGARTKLSAEDEDRRGRLAAMAAHPSARKLTDQGRRIVGAAGSRGSEAIQRARQSIQRRLEAKPEDLSMN